MKLTNVKASDLKYRFSKSLRDSLKERYGKLPSANVVARDFNLIAFDVNPVSQETVRRWMRGISMPEDLRLKVLSNWLQLDLNFIFKIPNQKRNSLKMPAGCLYLSDRECCLFVEMSNELSVCLKKINDFLSL